MGYWDLMDGTDASPCKRPCLSTKVYFLLRLVFKLFFKIWGSLFASRHIAGNRSFIELTFDQTVVTTESFYPTFSFLTFLTLMGGALGLWLGMGVLQILHVLTSCLKITILEKGSTNCVKK